MRINKKQFDKWIQALRSGKFKQGKGRLESSGGYCCLGVACKVLIHEDNLSYREGVLYGDFPNDQASPFWLTKINYDFKTKTGKDLSNLNDNADFSFDEIADLLEAVYVHKVLE